MAAPRIPVYMPDIGPDEENNVLECLKSTWISSKGRFLPEFESAFAAMTGATHAASVCNGTVALHLALVALGIGPGDEVLVPSMTYVASANAVVYTGATPVFCDCDPDTWQMSVEDARARLTDRTRAIMPVHLYGGACDMGAIMDLARAHDLLIVEDCAEAIGTLIGDQHVGSFGHASTFSFFGNKTITTGEGGMVVTNDADIADRLVHHRGQGLAKDREYWHDVIGFNYRMTNICAAIGLAQLGRADQFLARKQALAKVYRDQLADLPVKFQSSAKGTTHSHWMISILTETPEDRDALRAHLDSDGIETRPLFFPLHTMPMYAEGQPVLPVTEAIAPLGLCLPSWPGLTEENVARITQSIRSFFDRARS